MGTDTGAFVRSRIDGRSCTVMTGRFSGFVKGQILRKARF